MAIPSIRPLLGHLAVSVGGQGAANALQWGMASTMRIHMTVSRHTRPFPCAYALAGTPTHAPTCTHTRVHAHTGQRPPGGGAVAQERHHTRAAVRRGKGAPAAVCTERAAPVHARLGARAVGVRVGARRRAARRRRRRLIEPTSSSNRPDTCPFSWPTPLFLLSAPGVQGAQRPHTRVRGQAGRVWRAAGGAGLPAARDQHHARARGPRRRPVAR